MEAGSAIGSSYGGVGAPAPRRASRSASGSGRTLALIAGVAMASFIAVFGVVKATTKQAAHPAALVPGTAAVAPSHMKIVAVKSTLPAPRLVHVSRPKQKAPPPAAATPAVAAVAPATTAPSTTVAGGSTTGSGTTFSGGGGFTPSSSGGGGGGGSAPSSSGGGGGGG